MVLFSYYSCLMPKYDTIFRASTCPAAQNVYDSLYRRLGSWFGIKTAPQNLKKRYDINNNYNIYLNHLIDYEIKSTFMTTIIIWVFLYRMFKNIW